MSPTRPEEWSPVDPADPVARWARRIGSHAWMEQRLFEILGRWSVALDDDRAAIMAATHSAHHGWRAEQWRRHLPLLGGLAPESFVAPPREALGSLGEVLEPDSAMGPALDAARLAGFYRHLLPVLAAAYAAHATEISPVAEGPTSRTLRIVADDLGHDGVEGAACVERLISHLDDVTPVTAHERRVAQRVGLDTSD